MSHQSSATVRVLHQPHLAPDAVRVEGDCRSTITGVLAVPGRGWALSQRQQITMAVFEHEARCGACDTEAAHDQGDPETREQTDRAWRELLEAAGWHYAEEMRN
jgi:hypothetical protein